MSVAKIKCFFSWSGGKDSSLALHRLLHNPLYEVVYLVTTLNDHANRISMHGVREELLVKQAERIGIPLYQIRLPEMPDMDTYDNVMHQHFTRFREQGITHAVYGDIFLEDLKSYRDTRLTEAGLIGIYPLWKQDTHQLISEFLDLGFRSVIVCTQAALGDLVGEELSYQLIEALPEGTDVCGENGEFHTFVYAGPIFREPIPVIKGEKLFKEYKAPVQQDEVHGAVSTQLAGFWYQDLLLV